MTGTRNARGLAIAGALVGLAPIGAHVSALVLSLVVAALLTVLAIRPARTPA